MKRFFVFLSICLMIAGQFILFPFFTAEPTQAAGKPVYYQNQAIVLMYHHIAEQAFSEWTLSPEYFQEHLAMLEKEFQVISIEEMKAWLKEGKKIPDNAVVITFDDGYESYYHYAYPMLKEKKLPAVHFLIVGWMDKQPFLSWEQIREMYADGYTFYSHTYDQHHQVINHANGNKGPALVNRQYLPEKKRLESAQEYQQRLRHDLKMGKAVLQEQLGNTHQETIFSYPFGAGNTLTENLLLDLGYEMIVVTKKGTNGKLTSPLRIHRIDVGKPGIDGEKLKQMILEQVR